MRSGIGVGEHVAVEDVVWALIFGNAAVPIENVLVKTMSSNLCIQLGTYTDLKGE